MANITLKIYHVPDDLKSKCVNVVRNRSAEKNYYYLVMYASIECEPIYLI